MDTQMKHFYEFGEFRLEPSRRKFYHGGAVVPLTSKVFDLLVVLLQNEGRVLEKRYLLAEVWPDVIVEEHSLTQAVSVLRKVLGDKPNNHNYIKTVPGRGYQFIASVKDVIEEDAPVTGVELLDAHPQTQSLPVKQSASVREFFLRTLARRPYFAVTFLLIGMLAGILPPWLSSNASRISSPGADQLTSMAVQPSDSALKESCKTNAVTVHDRKQSCSNKARSKVTHTAGVEGRTRGDRSCD